MPPVPLPPHLSELLSQRSAGSPSALSLWSGALTRLHACGLPDSKEALLAREARTPRHLEDLAAFLGTGKTANKRSDHLLQCADESVHAVADWLEALSLFRQWLRHTGRHAPMEGALGYLECCDASVNSAPGLTDLPGTVKTMLDTYGFDG